MMLKTWWQERSFREQKNLKIGGIVIALLLGYFILWQPLDEAIATKKTLRETTQATFIWMQQADARLQSLNPSEKMPAFNARSPLASIQEALEQLAISDTPSELTQTEPHKIRLHFETVGFDALIALLTQLWETNRIAVEKIKITKTNTAGVVQAEIMLVTAQGSVPSYTS